MSKETFVLMYKKQSKIARIVDTTKHKTTEIVYENLTNISHLLYYLVKIDLGFYDLSW